MANNDELNLSVQARSIWGKTNRINDEEWLPLYVHMADSAAVSERIWDQWLPQGTKDVIARNLDGDERRARLLSIVIAGIHDIGKATPIFQSKPIRFNGSWSGTDSLAWKPRKAGLPIREDFRDANKPSHPIAGQVIVMRYLQERCGWSRDVAESYACVIGGHHGTPPSSAQIDEARLGYEERMGAETPEWRQVQEELIEFVLRQSGVDEETLGYWGARRLNAQSEVLLTGLTIMADWIASNSDENMFPLVPVYARSTVSDDDALNPAILDIASETGLRARAEHGWHNVSLPCPWHPGSIPDCNELFAERFKLPKGASARPVQREAVRIAGETGEPGLMVIEAPMGEGKTEAALAAAEIMAKRSGRGGVCVALPTMATTDAMFGRVHSWLESLPDNGDGGQKTVWLAHGKARLNDEFRGIIAASRHMSSVDSDEEFQGKDRAAIAPETVVSDWLWGRKKGALANFLVCTVDQVLMGALQMKHVVLRQLALANKVVIIDECHAYDAYMQEYLKEVLEWLGSFRTPVILLSATLPESQRNDMVRAYRQGYEVSGLRLEESGARRRGVRRRRRNQGIDVGTQPLAAPEADRDAKLDDAYPLITYTDGNQVHRVNVDPSGRARRVRCEIIKDDDASLAVLVERLLGNGGCVGIICDTVGRAQHAAKVLDDRLGNDMVKLTHSRFVDMDRMDNERELRGLLGPQSTIRNGRRPGRLIVVGTQVLEQSLDIDFDALIIDIAPVDLVMQRFGRLHRHHRGEGERDRPVGLREPVCYVRGVEEWRDSGPRFSPGVDRVYAAASLLESLAVLGLRRDGISSVQHLPEDIARAVRSAYGRECRNLIPEAWFAEYDHAATKRAAEQEAKKRKASSYLMDSVGYMNRNECSLTDWFQPQIDERDDDKGQRAVRDTQETVEVVLLHKVGDDVRLLPWIGDERHGVARGERVPTDAVPDDAVAKVAAQCLVRLPQALCRLDQLDELIGELEDECGDEVVLWQESPWLAGKLALFLNDDGLENLSAVLRGWRLTYSRRNGLEYARMDDN